MRVREHFLLGTGRATISVTARGTEDRETLFIHAMDAILAKYTEEFGPQNAVKLVEGLRMAIDSDASGVTWRLSEEDSCWAEVKRQLAGKDDI
ncbi:hypothetical protein [Alicyclobacillus mengziensis]|uniref:Uncharacterized protein n=1 Tax=Alicyclobacillus mengziensis TaxID=2931921 RepID=A0A9X7VVV5_9BACL|nr:hypothetical protein [Alicyclobacillus mengziensis]QSO46029.1 hypothetical protein JZ786_16030 [Alicyclobacillus mengziensis]